MNGVQASRTDSVLLFIPAAEDPPTLTGMSPHRGVWMGTWACPRGSMSPRHLSRMGNHVLIIGYGNTYCRDDGVALYILNAVRRRMNLNILQPDEDGWDELGHPIDTLMVHQLIPELAPSLAHYQKVFFVDAHQGTIPEEVRLVPVREEYGFHAVTHHMSPGMLLTLARQNNGFAPPGFLLSIKGEDFDFGLGISDSCRARADMAIEKILDLVEAGSISKATEEKLPE